MRGTAGIGHHARMIQSQPARAGRNARGKPGAFRHLRINPRTGMHEARDGRATLHRSALGVVEDLAVASANRVPPGYTGRARIAITYLGAAYWKVGAREAFVDSNRTLFLHAGDAFADRQVGQRIGRASVVLSPEPAILDELRKGARARAAMTGAAGLRTRRIAHSFLALGDEVRRNPLLGDELMLGALQDAIDPGAANEGAPTPRLVDRVKEILHEGHCDGVGLGEIAEEIGYSAVHVRKAFRRAEGMSLYRYQLHLRLNRALVELRDCPDITALALNLGFSSHSHFTASFRGMFGITPSEYRATMRAGVLLPEGWDS